MKATKKYTFKFHPHIWVTLTTIVVLMSNGTKWDFVKPITRFILWLASLDSTEGGYFLMLVYGVFFLVPLYGLFQGLGFLYWFFVKRHAKMYLLGDYFIYASKKVPVSSIKGYSLTSEGATTELVCTGKNIEIGLFGVDSKDFHNYLESKLGIKKIN